MCGNAGRANAVEVETDAKIKNVVDTPARVFKCDIEQSAIGSPKEYARFERTYRPKEPEGCATRRINYEARGDAFVVKEIGTKELSAFA